MEDYFAWQKEWRAFSVTRNGFATGARKWHQISTLRAKREPTHNRYAEMRVPVGRASASKKQKSSPKAAFSITR
ncbi:hypothetical protein [Caballeronia arationis]|uniref:hypothetical protein n=1 Tax=Caballeronia arationis TaxID=1777142 RepID=UPI000786A00E|nr:hypothetical protein [Caballeronia arationis]